MLNLDYYIKKKFNLSEKEATTILSIVNNVTGDWELDINSEKEKNPSKIYLKKNNGSVMVLTNGTTFHIDEHCYINDSIEMINDYSLNFGEQSFNIDSKLTLQKEDKSIAVSEHFDNTGRYYYNNESTSILEIIGENKELAASVTPDKVEKPIGNKKDINFIIHFGLASFFADANVELEKLYSSKKNKHSKQKIVKQP
jgi:hypothetical protein